MAGHSHDAHHDPDLAHHFESADQQFQSAKLGMWIFLATEILFFGGLFVAYSVYRSNHPEIFIYGHHFLDKGLGALNTVVLIFSSFTIAWAVRAAQLRQIKLLKLLLVATIACAFVFLGVKYVEYSTKWKHGLLWASKYDPHVEDHGEAPHGGEAEAHGAAEMSAETVPSRETGARPRRRRLPGRPGPKPGRRSTAAPRRRRGHRRRRRRARNGRTSPWRQRGREGSQRMTAPRITTRSGTSPARRRSSSRSTS